MFLSFFFKESHLCLQMFIFCAKKQQKFSESSVTRQIGRLACKKNESLSKVIFSFSFLILQNNVFILAFLFIIQL